VHIIDDKKFHTALRKKGYNSIGALSKTLGIHRNTIHYYLSGHGVFPQAFEKLIQALDLKPSDILIIKKNQSEFPFEQIASLIDQLHLKFPNISFILFGSRAKENASKYSDWDIGVFSYEGLPHEVYRNIVKEKNELIESLPFFVDIINLNRADKNFLIEISRDWKFLTGKVNDWIEIQRKAAA